LAIQTYVSIFDLIPTEPLWDKIDDQRIPSDSYTKEELYESIKEKGLKYQFRVDSNGKILDGNARYWTCRRLIEEGDTRFLFVPIEIDMCHGVIIINYDTIVSDLDILKNRWFDHIDTKNPVIPGEKEFKKYEFASETETYNHDEQYQLFHLLTHVNTTVQIGIETRKIEKTEKEGINHD